MSSQPDHASKHYRSQLKRSLHQAVAECIATHFPRVGGQRMVDLGATIILEAVSACLRPREQLSHGQILWMAVSAKNPPGRRQRITDAHLVPVVLDLSTPDDIQGRLDHLPPSQILLGRAIRLCRQTYEQGALLSNCDLAELLACSDTKISALLSDYEKKTKSTVPRRATLQDVGSAVTHKGIICYKHFVEGKTADLVAQDTYHTITSVDRYLGQYDRVRQCRLTGMTAPQIAHLLQCTVRLVQEYLTIDDELSEHLPTQPCPGPPAPEAEH